MTTIHLKGHITETGELQAKLPERLPAGDVEISIEIPELDSSVEAEPWTDEELKALLTPQPMSGAEIVAALRSGDLDTSAWVEDERRKRRDRFQW